MRIVLRSADFQQREISQRVIENTLGLADPEPDDVYVWMLARKRARQQSAVSGEHWSAGVFSDDNRLVYTSAGQEDHESDSDFESGSVSEGRERR